MKPALAIASACGILLFCSASAAQSQPYIINTVAGGGLPPTPMAGTDAGFEFIHSVITDTAGNVMFTADNAVFKLDPAGVLTRVAGRSRLQGYSGDGGLATSAQLNFETAGGTAGVAVDGAGNRYIADQYNHVVRKVAPNGIISTVAGVGVAGYSGDNGPAIAAHLSNPIDVAADAAGNLFILDCFGNCVRKLTPAGIISTVAGNPLAGPGYAGDGGPAVNAILNFASGIAIDAAGNLFISDQYNSRIRKVALNGTISTVAGNGMDASSGDGGPASRASIARPRSVSVDNAGNILITGGCRVRKIGTSGMITTVAGNGICGNAIEGQPVATASISPVGAAMDSACNLYIADSGGGVIRKVGPDGILRNAAGRSNFRFSGDGGAATSAQFHYVRGVAVDRLGNLLIADMSDNRVRRVSPDGTVATIAGNGTYASSGDGGPASAAALEGPTAVLPDAAGNVYIAEFSRVRKIAPNGIITTFAGSGIRGYSGDGGPAANAGIYFAQALALDAAGNLYIADSYNHRIRKVGTNGIITTVAGVGCAGYAGDGGPAVNALLNSPNGVAVDAAGNLYISERSNQRVRKVAPNGIITTAAGTGIPGFSGDGGAAVNAQLAAPQGIAVDAAGNLYIADSGRIRQVTPTGTINTIAGGSAQAYAGDGAVSLYAKLFLPAALAADSSGNIYIGDGGIVRVLTPVGGGPILSASLWHSGNFEAGQAGATFSATIMNHAFAGTTSGPVTVTEIVPAGLTLAGMSGTGWTCVSNSCTRSDPLPPAASYPPITVTVNVASNVGSQVLNQVTVTAAHAVPEGMSDLTSTPGLSEPVLGSPANAATGVSPNLMLNWAAVAGATSYDVYFGASPQPALLANTTSTSYSLSGLSPATAYHWRVVARGGASSASSVTWLFTTNGGKATMLSPAPGSSLAASSLTFTWCSSAGASAYWLDVGTVQGQGTIFGRNVGLATSQAVSGLPSSGIVYVRLWTQMSGTWQYNDYTYTASVVPLKAAMASPTPGATLHATETFSWTPGLGSAAYWLDVGTVQGKGDIFGNNVGLAQTQTVNGIPTSGGTIYVRLWSQLPGNWVYNDYTYTAGTLNTKAVMTSPAPGSTLPGGSATFTWTAAAGASAYWLDVGTVPGQGTLFAGNLGLSLSQAVSGIPATGGSIYVRLWTQQSGAWSYNDYTYTAAALGTKAVMVSPAPSSTLGGASVTFTWSPGSGASAYWLDVGTVQGQGTIFGNNVALATSQAVNGIPTAGGTIYVRLWTQQSGAWSFNDYVYTAATLGAKAVMLSPVPGSALSGATVTFNWSAGTGASAYWLDVGTVQAQGNIFGNNLSLATSQTVAGIPADGRPIYVRLWTQISGAWQVNDYTYLAFH